MSDFPKIGINTQELVEHVESLLGAARKTEEKFGGVNWGDLGVADIEYRLSMLNPSQGPTCVVLVEEADPGSPLCGWLQERIDSERFPNTYIECEW